MKAFKKDQHVQGMLKMGHNERENPHEKKELQGWGKTAHHIEKGMKALVKALPEQ